MYINNALFSTEYIGVVSIAKASHLWNL